MNEPSLKHFLGTRTRQRTNASVSFADLYTAYIEYLVSYTPPDDPSRYSEQHLPDKRFFGKMMRAEGFTPAPYSFRIPGGGRTSAYSFRGLELTSPRPINQENR